MGGHRLGRPGRIAAPGPASLPFLSASIWSARFATLSFWALCRVVNRLSRTWQPSAKQPWVGATDSRFNQFDARRIVIADLTDAIAVFTRRIQTELSINYPGTSSFTARLEVAEELSELVTLDQVAPLTGLSKRTLERYVQDGRIPQPDVPGGGGRAHKWYWNAIGPALSKVTNKPLPDRFPGSRII